MYKTGAQTRSRRSAAGGGRGRGQGLERERLIQLGICLALFLAVFLGKGIFPDRAAEIQQRLSAVLSADLDLQGALSDLGQSLAQGDTVLSDLGAFCAEVFGGSQEGAQPVDLPLPEGDSVLTAQFRYMSQEPDQLAWAQRYTGAQRLGLELTGQAAPPQAEQPAADPAPPPAAPAAGTVLIDAGYDGMPLPERYTMDKLSLGQLETTTPVLGHVNSVYGYRDHPIDGRYQFHGGVDLGGQMGDPIAAFAAGTVDYVGQDDSYGLYFQLDHGNGVKSFYAHCSEVLVKKGQQVALGETVARVGSSGAATGPHLHLELKYDGMHLDPIYYVDVLEDR